MTQRCLSEEHNPLLRTYQDADESIGGSMAAYIIFTRERTRNPSELETYSKKAPAAIAGYAVTPLAVYGRQEVLEGSEVEGVAILEFPSFDEAKAWYNSPAYREAREHRFRGADYRAVIVESL